MSCVCDSLAFVLLLPSYFLQRILFTCFVFRETAKSVSVLVFVYVCVCVYEQLHVDIFSYYAVMEIFLCLDKYLCHTFIFHVEVEFHSPVSCCTNCLLDATTRLACQV